MLIIKKDILVLGEVSTQGLHETPITAEARKKIQEKNLFQFTL